MTEQTTGRGTNGWNEWSKFVLKELERLNEQVEKLFNLVGTRVDKETCRSSASSIRDDIKTLELDVVALKVKAGIWGLIGGAIPVIIGLAVWIIKGSG
jgi:hypothetical protein